MTRRLNSGRAKQRLVDELDTLKGLLGECYRLEVYRAAEAVQEEIDSIREQLEEWGPERGDDA